MDINNTNTEMSGSVPPIRVEGRGRHPNSLKALKPFVKGQNVPAGRKPKGAASLPHALDRVIDRKNAEKIMETLVEAAMSGSVPAHRTMLEVGGALKGTQTQVNVQQNAPVITPESIKMMEEFLKQKGITDI